ncbi:alpha/beta-hydrolase [Penicillium canescens]|uniref:Alpha/beta-hydrolase n=1 Tax=Penicillium canescens TaxID=5083 RepID=A0AAD6N7M1_PENCN|nr:alpha/beta-hydrolase [Penicillium canescens]KAJ6038596.1 alpha/beta-hydrolase [Penicillium canescens]KAJ6047280.1 alpha/beta-hydrolase [Penicillium canescens]KAJ6059992.1 alpha/beta-hydrolase [Penicillium canescens]KAJ6093856.1 alpha/beta-hydrolase [Penicillium canescens]KAJ6174358.1 alpha/beta-hydrolase [Penicillium canescens]
MTYLSLEFSGVTPVLSKDYELFLVDLPGHSASREFLPLTLDNAVDALARLIKTKVPGGKTHLVGLSMGGFMILELARRHPELLLSLWCTGCAPNYGFKLWLFSQPRLLTGLIRCISSLANERMFWLSLGVKPVPGLREQCRKNQSMALLTAGFTELVKITRESLAEIKGVRIAIIAGAKLDNVRDATDAGKILGSANPECKGFVVREAIHWWDLQFPELFARGIRAWIEGREMPKECELLS